MVSGTGGTPIIEVDYKGDKEQFKAEENSSMVCCRGLMPPLTGKVMGEIFPTAVTAASIGLLESLLTLQLIDELTNTRGSAREKERNFKMGRRGMPVARIR